MIKEILGIGMGILIFNLGAAFGGVLSEKARIGRDAQYERLLRGNAYGALVGFKAVRSTCEGPVQIWMPGQVMKVCDAYIKSLEEGLKK